MPPDAVKRVVRLGSMVYIDPDGLTRRADCGTEIMVHPDNVERFDRLNVLAGEEPPVEEKLAEPKRRGRPRKDT